MTQISPPASPRRVVDLETLAGLIADDLASPTYALDVVVTGNTGDGFLTFDARDAGRGAYDADGMTEVVVRAVVNLVSDGEDPIDDATGEVIEIVVRRAAP